MKTPEELNTLKGEGEPIRKKHAELSDDELTQVTGGCGPVEAPAPPVILEEIPILEAPEFTVFL